MKSQIDPIYVYVYLKQADISYPIPSMEIGGRKAHTVWLGDIINEKKSKQLHKCVWQVTKPELRMNSSSFLSDIIRSHCSLELKAKDTSWSISYYSGKNVADSLPCSYQHFTE